MNMHGNLRENQGLDTDAGQKAWPGMGLLEGRGHRALVLHDAPRFAELCVDCDIV